MSARTLPIGTTLRGDDGAALVVEPGTSVLDGLLALLQAEYGGEPFAATNPAIVAALPRARVAEWRSCTKPWCEANNVDDDYYGSWWAPDGDGARVLTVAYYDGDAYTLGEEAEATESPSSPVSLEPATDPEEKP